MAYVPDANGVKRSKQDEDSINTRSPFYQQSLDMQQLSEQMAKETFVSTSGLKNTVDTFEWDLLVGRGTGNAAVDSRWERESLYQKFDPLVSGSKRNPPVLGTEKKRIDNLKSDQIGNDFPRPIVPQQPKDTTPPFKSPFCQQSNLSPGMDHVSEQMAKETFVSSAGLHNTVDTFEWDLLVSRGTGNVAVNSKWERESLYQKFDPLVSAFKRNPAVIGTDEKRIDNLRSDQIVVNDFQRPIVPQPSKDTTPINKNRRNMIKRNDTNEDYQTDSSSFSPQSSCGSSIVIQSSDELEIKKLKEVLERQAKNFQNQLNERSVQLKELEATIAAASKRLDEQQQSHRVLKEYEKSVATLQNEIDQVKNDIAQAENDEAKIAAERDYAVEDLRQAEISFSDLHSKYEKLKNVVGNFKKNEDVLEKRYEVMKLKIERRDAKLKCLQDTVEDVFGKMKNDFESSIKSEEVENNRIRAQLRKLELRMSTIQKDLEQKEKENSQLSLLCDDLIKGQGAK